MIASEKLQELKDAAAHAKHNGGLVRIEHDILVLLLDAWDALTNNPPEQPVDPPSPDPAPIVDEPNTESTVQ